MNQLTLECIDLNLYFGNHHVLKNFNMKIYNDKIYGLIGPNGAGKTTIFNLLTKIYSASSGKIILNGKDIKKYEYSSNQ